MPDAAIARTSARGGPCAEGGATCETDLACLADLPGGTCASKCGDVGGARCADGAVCVDTPRDGDVCLAACARDADCRADDGYLCDPVWHACAVPGFAAIVARRCAPSKLGHEAAFGSAELVDVGEARAPAGVVGSDGAIVVAAATAGGIAGAPGGAITAVGEQPAIARVGDLVLVAWRAGSTAMLATSRANGAWSEAHPLPAADDCTADATCPDRPRLAASPRALYASYSGDAIGTRVRSSRDGGATWSAPVTALTGARGDLAASGDGRLHVIAMTGGTGGAYGAAQHVLEYAASSDGGRTFSRAVAITARDAIVPAYFANPTLALDDRRNWIYVAYARGGADAAWIIELAASKDKGKTWSRTRVADDGCALAMVPSVAVDPTTGNVHVAWYDTRGPRFAHAACAAGGVRCSERGAIQADATPFASLGAGRLDARWIGDAATLVIDDRRRVLHALWAQPIADGDRVATHVFHARARLK